MRTFLFIFILQLAYIKCYAQFFTISADSLHQQVRAAIQLPNDTLIREKKGIIPIMRNNTDSIQTTKRETKLFPDTRGCEISIEKDLPLFVVVRNNPLFDLIQKRVTVCLPLDYLKQNSGYGYRKDPVYAFPDSTLRLQRSHCL